MVFFDLNFALTLQPFVFPFQLFVLSFQALSLGDFFSVEIFVLLHEYNQPVNLNTR